MSRNKIGGELWDLLTKADSQSVRIGGWTRIWIVMSVLWVMLWWGIYIVDTVGRTGTISFSDILQGFGLSMIPPLILLLFGRTVQWIMRKFRR